MNAEAIYIERRSMNHMDPDTKVVHLRLEEWGRWAKDGEIRAWPTITPMGKMIEEGPHGAGQSTKPPIDMPQHIAEVDAAVAKLGTIDQLVIKRYYQFWEPREVLARRCQMRVRQFDNVVKRARWRIQLSLNAVSNSG